MNESVSSFQLTIPNITSFEVNDQIIQFFLIIIGLIIALIIKDMISTLTSGFLFKLNKNFNEGHIVYLDGELATIISIGYNKLYP